MMGVSVSMLSGDNEMMRRFVGSLTADGLTPVVYACPADLDIFVRSDGTGAWRINSIAVTDIVNESDMAAFTVTPAPGPLGLLGAGALIANARRRRNP